LQEVHDVTPAPAGRFQGLEIQPTFFSNLGKKHASPFQALEKSPQIFPNLGQQPAQLFQPLGKPMPAVSNPWKNFPQRVAVK
jgi:hypothetical protein